MSLLRSFRLRIALLTAVVAGIVFGLFSVVAYSTIHGELEKHVDTRIMIEARQTLGRGLMHAAMLERASRMRARDAEGEQRPMREARAPTPGRAQQPRGGPERRPPSGPRQGANNRASAAVGDPATDELSREVAESELLDPLEEAQQQEFAGCLVETRDGETKELYRTDNWPPHLSAAPATWGVSKPIAPTEITDLLRGQRTIPVNFASPPQRPGGRSGEGDERDGTIPGDDGEGEVGRDRSDDDRENTTAGTEGGPGDGRLQRGGDRRGERDRGRRGGRNRWRGGFFLTQEPHFHYSEADENRWRVGVFSSDRHTVIVAASLEQFTANVQKLRSAFAIAIPAAVLLIALGAWVVSGQAIRPIRDIADTAENVTAAGLSQRIAEPGTSDELQRLTIVLNKMLDRLEDGFKQATRFSADASHELKTPLTIMQGELEAALREAPQGSPQQSVFASQLEEVTRLKRIVASLLLLSRADAGQLNLTRERIDISTNFAAICEDAEIIASESGISLETKIEPGLSIMGDRSLLQQVFQNLISNAVKYNVSGGTIHCALFADRDGDPAVAVVDIENTGPGIPEEDQDKVFRRFHRADAARGREVDGFGLGLNLALEIAKAHNGTLNLIQSNSESTLFRLRIPLA